MTDAIVIALIAALPVTIVGIAALIQGVKTHATFNSKMDKLLATVKSEAFAAGEKSQKEAQALIEAAVITASKKLEDKTHQAN